MGKRSAVITVPIGGGDPFFPPNGTSGRPTGRRQAEVVANLLAPVRLGSWRGSFECRLRTCPPNAAMQERRPGSSPHVITTTRRHRRLFCRAKRRRAARVPNPGGLLCEPILRIHEIDSMDASRRARLRRASERPGRACASTHSPCATSADAFSPGLQFPQMPPLCWREYPTPTPVACRVPVGRFKFSEKLNSFFRGIFPREPCSSTESGS